LLILTLENKKAKSTQGFKVKGRSWWLNETNQEVVANVTMSKFAPPSPKLQTTINYDEYTEIKSMEERWKKEQKLEKLKQSQKQLESTSK
jgi:hypothetical protein